MTVIYLDNAATTYPKPPQVYRAWQHAMTAFGANPGRAGHRFSAESAQAVFGARESCAQLFGAEPENTVFTLNCTHALNFAIKGLAKQNCHFVCSDLEHNAVIRPIHAAAERFGGSYTLFETSQDAEQTVRNAERAMRGSTVALVCTAASNVTGRRLPLKELAELCRRKNVCFIVDAAQGAGVLPLNMNDGINILCCAGHKGLYGPMGTGLMITDGSYHLNTIIEGGTGSASESIVQPDFSPDRFESGTMNTAGAAALGSGADFVRSRGTEKILEHELKLCRMFCRGAERLERVSLLNNITEANSSEYAPVVSFNIDGLHSTQGADLFSRHGIFMRGGLHCAPLAHRKAGTLEIGAIRFAPSIFNSPSQVEQTLNVLKKICMEEK